MTPIPTPVHRCPHCEAVSANPGDVTNGYCGRCHHFCADYPDTARFPAFDDAWCVPGTRVVVGNVRSGFYGHHGRVIRRHPSRLVDVRLDDDAPVGDVEFGTGELIAEVTRP